MHTVVSGTITGALMQTRAGAGVWGRDSGKAGSTPVDTFRAVSTWGPEA